MAKKQLPRGIRNNNPGNIEYQPNTQWQGLADPPVEPEGRFARFIDATYGIRAIARLLITYQTKHKCDTVRKIIDRWAPPTENNTAAYIRSICEAVDAYPDEMIDVRDYHTIKPLVKAIIKHENGQQPYSDAQIDKALTMAGIQPPKKPLAKSRTMVGAAGAAATGGAAITLGMADQIAQVAPAVTVAREVAETAHTYPNGLLIVFGLAVLVAAAYIAWARYDDRRKGLR
jgi:hypothetical protein